MNISPTVVGVAKVLLTNVNNEALLLTLSVHRLYPENSFKPDLPGGIVDPGESGPQAVARELFEETGILLDPAQFTMAYTTTDYVETKNESIIKELYVAKCPDVPTVTLSWEHSAYKWVPLDEVRSGAGLRPFYVEAIKHVFAQNLIP